MHYNKRCKRDGDGRSKGMREGRHDGSEVRLYEDNAGGLYIWEVGHDDAYRVDGALPGATFREDAESIAAGEG